MDLAQRIKAFSALGEVLKDFVNHKDSPFAEKLNRAVREAFHNNGWFTEANVMQALKAWGTMLTEENLETWVKPYEAVINNVSPKNIGVIMAGNIPLVGFHDMLSVLISGHIFTGKLSSSDSILIKAVTDVLLELDSVFNAKISFTIAPFKDIDAIIATGSNNTARYFEYYFGKYPHIIRKNRTSAAILTGKESPEEIKELGKDIFSYYGLGCRNVSKLHVPKEYDFKQLFEPIFEYADVVNNKKYGNNYDYNKTVYLLNNIKLLDNGFLLLKEDESLFSPVGVLFYEYYDLIEQAEEKLQSVKESLQCVVGKNTKSINSVPFGKAQEPNLSDYADGVDTMKFLVGL